MHLHRFERNLCGRLRRVELHGRRFGECWSVTTVGPLDMAKDEVLHVHPRHLHSCELELDELEIANWMAELDTIPCIVNRQLQAPLNDPKSHCSDTRPLGGKRPLGAV